jgi:hypothetical protein
MSDESDNESDRRDLGKDDGNDTDEDDMYQLVELSVSYDESSLVNNLAEILLMQGEKRYRNQYDRI